MLLAVAVGALCVASAASAMGVRGLSATIGMDKAYLTGADSAIVHVTLRNDSAQDLYVLRWQTPIRGVEANIFDVRVDGQPAAYVGLLAKRAAPQASDYLRIPAGRELTADVDLSGYYDMTRTGEYSVRYRVGMQDALRGIGTHLGSVAGLPTIESNQVVFGVERDSRGRLLQTIAQSHDDGIGQVVGAYLTPGYVSCTSSRQSSLLSALSYGQSISLKARDYLNNLPSTSRSTDAAYKTWFGAYTSSRYSTVQSHYTNIYSTFSTKTYTFYCDCTDPGTYAYVYANQPYKVHLCGAFWNAPSSGIDSKGGTLVHETSHFNVVAGTQDYVYGTAGCKNLAISNPSQAVNNADTHEYFAETR